MRLINLLIIHCAATANGKQLGGTGQTAAQIIDGWHLNRGFHRSNLTTNPNLKAIGYHYVIDCDGTVLTGRSEDEIGAHVEGHNANSLGICMVGTDAFTQAQWQALHDVITELSAKYPDSTIHGHNEYSNKICPGFCVTDWVDGGFSPLACHVTGGV